MLSKQELHSLYWEDEMSLRDVGKTTGVCPQTVLNRMRRYGIPRRTTSEANSVAFSKGKRPYLLVPKNSVEITDELREYLDGLLLGDGHLAQKTSLSAGYQQSFAFRYSQWVFKIKSDLERFGLKSVLCYDENRKEFNLYTRCYPELLEQRKRWYPNGKKRVPCDIKLTPVVIANWYLGDGSLDSRGQAKFSTYSFTNEKLAFLKDEMIATLDIFPFIHRGQILIRVGDVARLLDHIPSNFRLGCFSHKFNGFMLEAKHKKWTEDEVELLEENLDVPIKRVARKLRRSYNSVKLKRQKVVKELEKRSGG